MANKSKKKSDLKDAYLSIRLSVERKKMIKKRAEKLGKTTSEYALDCIFAGTNKNADWKWMGEANVIFQYMCNYIEEKYGGDEILEEGIEKIWEIMLSK